MRDPFSYGPREGGQSTDMPTVTGDDKETVDRDALRQDLRRLLNP